jgi:lipase chaperone LimK
MSKITKLIALFIFIITLVGIIFLFMQPSAHVEPPQVNQQKTAVEKPITIATTWQWQPTQTKTSSSQIMQSSDSNLPFTAESVHNALQAVKLDKAGNIILDHDALVSLDETLERIHDRLDSDSLEQLKQLIKNALPGVSGEQTAKIVGDYYHYLEAKQEFSQINEAIANANDQETIESVETDQALYAELQALRETHLGYAATQKLFRVSDANANYMFESMKLERDDSLTIEEKNAKRQEIRNRHIEQSVNIPNWPSRYQAFLNDKQVIVSAMISDEEKQKQLRNMLSEHFTSNELKRIEYLALDRP